MNSNLISFWYEKGKKIPPRRLNVKKRKDRSNNDIIILSKVQISLLNYEISNLQINRFCAVNNTFMKKF